MPELPEVEVVRAGLAPAVTGARVDAVRVLAVRARVLLRRGGVLGVEHADVQGDAVPAVLAGAGAWTEVADHHDLAGRPRFTTARLAR